MAQLSQDVIGHILIRLGVRDLLRCRSVSKSWLSLISDHEFIKSHLENSHRRDRDDDKIGSRKIVMSFPRCYSRRLYEIDDHSFDFGKIHLLGSSNGLVCVSNFHTETLVINPETREVNKLKKNPIPVVGYLIGGFGYDSSTNDYKVVLGFAKGSDFTCFLLFTSKSNNWKVIGEVNYTLISRVGILFNGGIHWIACHDNQKVILCFDLSEDKFKEIPQPDDMRYDYGIANSRSTRLGIMDDCLCLFQREKLPHSVWVMNNYNVRQSWEFVGPGRKLKTEVVHRLKELKHYIPNKKSLCHEDWIVRTPEFLGALLYVPSLVSPHICSKPKRKRQETGSTKSGKVPNLNLVQNGSSDVGNLER